MQGFEFYQFGLFEALLPSIVAEGCLTIASCGIGIGRRACLKTNVETNREAWAWRTVDEGDEETSEVGEDDEGD